MAGIFAVATALLGFFSANLSNDKAHLSQKITGLDSQIGELEQALSGAETRSENRARTIEELRSEVTNLKRLVPPTIDPEDTHDVRSTHTVKLADGGDTLDLNSTLVNFDAGKKWIVTDGIKYSGARLQLSGVAHTKLAQGAATFETCAVASGWKEDYSIEPHRITDATECFRLDSGRFASIVVTAHDADFITLAIVVWE